MRPENTFKCSYYSPVKHHENIYQNNSIYNYLDTVHDSWAKRVSKIATVKEPRRKHTLGKREILCTPCSV